MDKLTLCALLFLMLSAFRNCFNAQADPVYVDCTSDYGQYSSNTTFAENVKRVLNMLVSNTAVSGLNNTSFGEGQDQVYGEAFCRGDVGYTDCQNCIKNASSKILSNCSTKDGILWNERCQLHYSGRNFFLDTEYGGKFPLSNSNEKLASDPERFYSLVDYLIKNISGEAVDDTSKFATGEINYSDKQSIYGLVQCQKVMPSDECNTCLRGALGDLKVCCSSREGGTIVSKHCNVRYQVYQFYNGSSSYYLTDPTPKGTGKKWVIVLVACVLGLILIALAGSCVVFIKRRKKKKDEERTAEELYNDLVTPVGVTINQEGDFVGSEELPFMDLNIIKAATDNFSIENKLGKGGFGTVYKVNRPLKHYLLELYSLSNEHIYTNILHQGVLHDGKEVAVKRLSRKSWQGIEEFKNEIKLIAKLQHKNLVRLVGCGLEGDEKLLVYEYVPNKSLDMFIFNEERRSLLDWKTCHAIIDGIARGLVYLHEDSRLRIIHRDLKPSNVLLDSEMVAKISDFGMARIFDENQNTANTKRVVGTYGYMAPEYAMGGLFSVKSDVFSFGVIVLEILSGKRNSGFYLTGQAQTLLAYAWRLWNAGRGLELVDFSLVESGSADEMLRCIHIGLLCVQEDPEDRPTMLEIVTLFNNETWNPPQPNQPAFSISRVVPGPDQSYDNTSCSVNELTISAVYPR